jgi:hypothetical protein
MSDSVTVSACLAKMTALNPSGIMITTTINFLEQFAYLLLRSWHPILRFSLRNTILCLKFDVSERQKFPYRLVWSFCCAVPLPLDVSETVFSHAVLRFSRLAFFNVICALFRMGEPGLSPWFMVWLAFTSSTMLIRVSLWVASIYSMARR